MRSKDTVQITGDPHKPANQSGGDGDPAPLCPNGSIEPSLFSTKSAEADVSDLLSIRELSRRLGVSEKAIRRKIEKGVLIRGIHWFRPKGYRTIFSWRAIEAFIREHGGPYPSGWPTDASDGLYHREEPTR